MPELPEVETIKNQLKPKIVGKTIKSVFFHPDFGNTLKFRNTRDIEAIPAGRKITEVSRVGKYLIFTLSDGNYLIFHLKIYGRIVANSAFQPPSDHIYRFSLTLEDGTMVRFFDKSNIADIRLMDEGELGVIRRKTGPEPFDLSPEDFHTIITSAKFPRIKDAILDQGVISGVGNIYADEALFKAKISPFRKPQELNSDETRELLEAIKDVLQSGIEHRGTSIESYYDAEGNPGENQNYLQIYGRGNQSCKVCNNPITLTEISGRRTHYCESCQPASQLTLF